MRGWAVIGLELNTDLYPLLQVGRWAARLKLDGEAGKGGKRAVHSGGKGGGGFGLSLDLY